MMLYHYTSRELLKSILNDKQIKLTCSNLLKPVNPKMIGDTFADITDSYKPVVWFASFLDFNKAQFIGVNGSNYDKTEAAIQIDTAAEIQTFHKWDKWALDNNINRKWFDILKDTAPAWDNFYITEAPVNITDKTRIIFRPDIMKQMNGGAQT